MPNMAEDIHAIRQMLEGEFKRQKFHRIFKGLFYVGLLCMMAVSLWQTYQFANQKFQEVTGLIERIEDKAGGIESWTKDNFNELKDGLNNLNPFQ